MKNSTIPLRSQVAESDQWNLTRLFKDDSEWNKALEELSSQTKNVLSYKDALQNVQTLITNAILVL